MKEFKSPCVEKNCSFCCNPVKNPVKVPFSFPDQKIPLYKKGDKLWEENKNEMLAPANDPDATKLKVFSCRNFDIESVKCVDYENRPQICKETSCINLDSKESVDEQHKKIVRQEFYRIKKPL